MVFCAHGLPVSSTPKSPGSASWVIFLLAQACAGGIAQRWQIVLRLQPGIVEPSPEWLSYSFCQFANKRTWYLEVVKIKVNFITALFEPLDICKTVKQAAHSAIACLAEKLDTITHFIEQINTGHERLLPLDDSTVTSICTSAKEGWKGHDANISLEPRDL